MRARGWSPISLALVSDMRSTAAAPSLSGQEFPAVTLPSSLKAGGNSASFSSVELGRGPSSFATSVPSPEPGVLVGLAGRLLALVVATHPLDAGADVDVTLVRLDRVARVADRDQ